jgi:hypothetical protein
MTITPDQQPTLPPFVAGLGQFDTSPIIKPYPLGSLARGVGRPCFGGLIIGHDLWAGFNKLDTSCNRNELNPKQMAATDKIALSPDLKSMSP